VEIEGIPIRGAFLCVFSFSRGVAVKLDGCQVTVGQDWSMIQKVKSLQVWSSVTGHQGSFSGQDRQRSLRSFSERQVWSREQFSEQSFEQGFSGPHSTVSFAMGVYPPSTFLQSPISATSLSNFSLAIG